MRRSSATLPVLLLLTPAFVFAQTDAQKAFADNLRKNLKKNIVTLRSFDQRNDLSFDAEGNPQGTPKPGTWIFNSKIEVSDVRLKPDRVEVEGNRLWVKIDPQDKRTFVRGHDRARVHIAITADEDPQRMQAAINRVFVPASESMAELVPPYWKAYFTGEHKRNASDGPCAGCSHVVNGQTLFRRGGGVTAPRPIYAADPEYTDLARENKYQATITLSAIVTADGTIGDVAIIRPAGLGLDEKAVEAVRK